MATGFFRRHRAGLALAGAMCAMLVAWGIASTMQQEARKRFEHQVWQDFRKMNVAVVSYSIDRCGSYFPPDTWERRQLGQELAQTFETDIEFITQHVNYGHDEPVLFWHPATTPVAYLDRIPRDAFNKRRPYSYKTLPVPSFRGPASALVRSVGPNGKPDLDIDKLYIDFLEWRERSMDLNGRIDATASYLMLREELIPHVYDPTNGTVSSGDIIGLVLQSHPSFDNWNSEEHVASMTAQWERRREERPGMLAEPEFPVRDRATPLPAPGRFSEHLARFNILSYDMDIDYAEAIRSASNQFGSLFLEVFDSPAPLTAPQRGDFKPMTEKNPLWWSFIGDPGLDDVEVASVPITNARLTAYTPLIGRSMLLLAADRAGRGDADAARRTLEGLERLVSLLDVEDPHHAHIHAELTRMRTGLLAAMEPGYSPGDDTALVGAR